MIVELVKLVYGVEKMCIVKVSVSSSVVTKV